jgi:caa(3)-type oxidase subunit IV
MASDAHSGPGYVTIWVWLVMLLAAGMAIFFVDISKTVAILLIFGIAVVKAFLVVRHYMHLKHVPPALYAIAGIPLLLAIAMVISLIPDIGHNYRPSTPVEAHAEP